MKTKYEDHEVEVICRSCDYDLSETDLENLQCKNCGEPLQLKQNVTVSVTMPPLFGGSM